MKQTIGFPADGEIQEHLLEPKEGGARTRIAYLYMDCLLSLCGIAFKWGTCIHYCFPFGRWKHLTPSNMAAELSRIGLPTTQLLQLLRARQNISVIAL